MITLGPIAALGTTWWVEVHDLDIDQAAIEQWLNRRLITFNDTYTRFTTTSLVGTLNTSGKVENAPQEFLDLVQQVKHWYLITNGVFNALTANQQVSRGYGQPETAGAHQELAADPITDLAVTGSKVTLHKGALDLGGFGKGWLIDAIARELQQEFRLQYFLVNGGGDMYATILPDNSPFQIQVEHPTVAGVYIASIPLTNQAFAASSTYKRQWQNNGQTATHIITPGNDQETDPIANHVVAGTAEAADVFATVGCINKALMDDQGFDYCLLGEEYSAVTPRFQTWLL
ncbi:MAG: FAD:protein FMN transferase [Patescibacteria group bacterium]